MQILEKRTLEEFGYEVSKLSKGSGKKVIHLCSVCGKEKITAYRDLLRGKGLVHNKCKSVLSKKTCLDRYGVDNPAKLESVKVKIVETNRIRYGKDYHTQTDTGKEKIVAGRLRKNYFKYVERLIDAVPLFGVEEFTGIRNTFYKFKCIKCNRQFEDHFNDQKSPRCPSCYPKYSYSKQQKDLYEFIKSFYSGEIIENYRLDRQELDIYLPELNFAIEYHGLYYHSEIAGGKGSGYHLNKLRKCLDRGITLIQVFEDEWVNKRPIVESVIKHKLRYADKRIPARKCSVVELDTAKEFLDSYHLQGNASSSIKLGLMYNGDLVAVMTFSKMRKCLNVKTKDGSYELVRFASKYSVIGGASKLFSYFVNKYDPSEVTTYADLRWSTGDLYYQLSFKYVHTSKPNYWYVNLNTSSPIRYHRFNFRKSVLKDKLEKFNPDKTEFENMVDNGWDRVWDCGNMKFIWRKQYD